MDNSKESISKINAKIKSLKRKKWQLRHVLKTPIQNTEAEWQKIADQFTGVSEWHRAKPRIKEVSFKSLIAKYQQVNSQRLILRICSSNHENYRTLYQTVLIAKDDRDVRHRIRRIQAAWCHIKNSSYHQHPQIKAIGQQDLIITEHYGNEFRPKQAAADLKSVFRFHKLLEK